MCFSANASNCPLLLRQTKCNCFPVIAISNIVLRLSIKFAARGDVIVIASKSIAISHKTPSDTRIAAIWMCRHVRNSGPGVRERGGERRGRTERGAEGGRRHKTSKRFIKYHTAEHCYDTSMQILFCVHEGAINDLPSPPPPPLPPLSLFVVSRSKTLEYERNPLYLRSWTIIINQAGYIIDQAVTYFLCRRKTMRIIAWFSTGDTHSNQIIIIPFY